MQKLTEEQRAFLLYKTRTGKLATVRKDGRPHLVPIWFLLDGDTIVFNTGESRVKALNIKHDQRVSLCVDDENAPYAFLVVEGVATLSDELDQVRFWATKIGGRYMGMELAEQYGARNGVPGELLVRITPTKILFAKNVAD